MNRTEIIIYIFDKLTVKRVTIANNIGLSESNLSYHLNKGKELSLEIYNEILETIGKMYSRDRLIEIKNDAPEEIAVEINKIIHGFPDKYHNQNSETNVREPEAIYGRDLEALPNDVNILKLLLADKKEAYKNLLKYCQQIEKRLQKYEEI